MSDPSEVRLSDTRAGESESLRTRRDWEESSPLGAVIQSVAVATGQDPMSLPTLNEVIDPDALDALCRHRNGTDSDDIIQVSFTYAGCEVTVESDGTVMVQLPR